MAIVPLRHVTLAGKAVEKSRVLTQLQEKGYLHIIGLVAAPREGQQPLTTRTREAYHYLKTCRHRLRQVRDPQHFEPAEVEAHALRVKEQSRRLEEERDYLLRRIETLRPWGNFSFPPLAATGGYRLWFYVVPWPQLSALAELELIWQVVGRSSRFAYVVVVSQKEPRGLPVPRVHTGNQSLAALRRRLEQVELQLEDLAWQRIGLSRWCYLLGQVLATADDRVALQRAALTAYDDEDLFLLQGWLPRSCEADLADFCQSQGVLLQSRKPQRGDRPPTLLQVQEKFSAGKQLVGIYTTPEYHLWDPSLPVLFTFVLFFSMILADAGYGALVLVAWLLWRRRLASSMAYLLLFLGGGAVVYGMLVGSFFGLQPPPDTVLAQLWLLDMQQQENMMALSVAIGVGHLMFAHGVNFFQARQMVLRLPPLGWLAILAGGMLTWLAAVGRIPRLGGFYLGWGLLIGGGMLVLLFSSTRPWQGAGWRPRLLRLLDGFLALTGVSRAFGDVLSYLRLFALGLASAQLAFTFNELARQTAAGIAGMGTLLAVLVLVVGHGLNFALALMGGVIHGLRLNFIEFFNWGVAEEGYPFQPFCKKGTTQWNSSS